MTSGESRRGAEGGGARGAAGREGASLCSRARAAAAAGRAAASRNRSTGRRAPAEGTCHGRGVGTRRVAGRVVTRPCPCRGVRRGRGRRVCGGVEEAPRPGTGTWRACVCSGYGVALECRLAGADGGVEVGDEQQREVEGEDDGADAAAEEALPGLVWRDGEEGLLRELLAPSEAWEGEGGRVTRAGGAGAGD